MITLEEYKSRQKKLITKMGEQTIGIIPGSIEKRRNGDVNFPFRQQSDFYYLTGFKEKDAILVLLPHNAHHEVVLFISPPDEKMAKWVGPTVSLEEAASTLPVDKVLPLETFEKSLKRWLPKKQRIYYDFGFNMKYDRRMSNWVRHIEQKGRGSIDVFAGVFALRPIMGEMRLFKSTDEITLIKQAVDISVVAHQAAMEQVTPGMRENELAAIYTYEMMRQGAPDMAYAPIVAGGKNGCILHYTKNNDILNDGDLVLVDAGAEYEYYAADITRTFPVGGELSTEQQAIYDLVLRAQKAGIGSIRPGEPYNIVQNVIVDILTEGLVELGILSGSPATLVEEKAYEKFYYHSSGHWLGLDVHDAGAYKKDNQYRRFETDMVLTVEPGLYLSPQEDLDEKWWNIAVRIEDDVLVSESGPNVLSAALTK